MNITVSELRFFSDEIRIKKEGKFKYKNRYWRWKDNNKETIEISKDNKNWREPKGREIEIIEYL